MQPQKQKDATKYVFFKSTPKLSKEILRAEKNTTKKGA
jgi:hypothetical protein